jgi:hypothetical protein
LAGSGTQGAPRWDGEPGRPDRYGTPVLNVLIRWDSALPVRQALKSQGAWCPTPKQADQDYVVTIIGLVPSRAAPASASDAAAGSEIKALIANSSIRTKTGATGRPENATIDADGALHLFFPRTFAIKPSDKEVTVNVRFGGMSISKRFRLKDMRLQGELQL